MLMDSKKGNVCSKYLPNAAVLFWGERKQSKTCLVALLLAFFIFILECVMLFSLTNEMCLQKLLQKEVRVYRLLSVLAIGSPNW